MPDVGRNDPCPCGSGKKYKKCCLLRQEAERSTAGRKSTVHELDGRLVDEIARFCRRKFGEDYDPLGDFPMELTGNDTADMQFFAPWAAYHHRLRDRRAVDWFLEERGRRLDAETTAWLDSQRKTWISYWEVTDVVPEKGLAVRDMLSGEERFVHEVLGSKVLDKWHATLARVVDHAGESVFCGMLGYPLAPHEAAEAVKLAKGRLRTRARIVPVDRLREPEAEEAVISAWMETVHRALHRPPPRLQNTDGEDLLPITDHFAIAPGRRAEVDQRLEGMEGAERSTDEDGTVTFSFSRPGNPMEKSWDNTIIGSASIRGDELRAETNSLRRADALRERLEAACGDALAHRRREQVDPTALFERAAKEAAETPMRRAAEEPTQPEMLAALRDFKQAHYREWLDESIPALDGLTPRKAARTAKMKPRLVALVKDIEHGEQKRPEAERFDVAVLWRELGLDPDG
jgi:hypothetical protein